MMSFWVALSGWSKDREVRVQDGFAYFEVAEQGHCSTCQGRINSVRFAIEKSGIASTDTRSAYLHDRYPSDAKTLWIGVKTEESVTMAQVVEKLKTVMSLPIVHAYQR